ncbi:MAG: hypothetical protein AWM53_01076 [Candidatus Dichloromethanomonas elyunquensis]|nr:MAG: hypothetical protein AWM53_01076 [Candidatus Dichloromethanomonas elyunquensis]
MNHNVYFEGKVQSLSLSTKNGKATVGVITPGKFSFSTSTQERMVIISGSIHVKLPEEEWTEISGGEEFIVEANRTFEVDAENDVAYLCYYKD